MSVFCFSTLLGFPAVAVMTRILVTVLLVHIGRARVLYTPALVLVCIFLRNIARFIVPLTRKNLCVLIFDWALIFFFVRWFETKVFHVSNLFHYLFIQFTKMLLQIRFMLLDAIAFALEVHRKNIILM